jgi:hypothetical protein
LGIGVLLASSGSMLRSLPDYRTLINFTRMKY